MDTGQEEKEIRVLFNEGGIVAIHKPAGMLVHIFAHQKNEKGNTVVKWALRRFPEIASVGDDPEFRPGIVHRLDRETSGVLLLARTQETFEYLKSLFQKHKIKKTYYAIVQGVPNKRKGTIAYPIGIKGGTTRRTIHNPKRPKEAITEYETVRTVEKNGQKFSLIKVHPLTGRTHQIRIHLNAIHTPVLGDKLYGGKVNSLLAPRHMLHCASLEFKLPDGAVVKIEDPLSGEFSDFFDKSA